MWDTVIEPAPMASTASALAISVSKPNEGVNGAIMVAVVIMARLLPRNYLDH